MPTVDERTIAEQYPNQKQEPSGQSEAARLTALVGGIGILIGISLLKAITQRTHDYGLAIDKPQGDGYNIRQSPLCSDMSAEGIRTRISSIVTTSVEVETELAVLLDLSRKVLQHKDKIYDAEGRLDFILRCLSADPAQLVRARSERMRLQYSVYLEGNIFSRILARLGLWSPSALVLCAIIMSLCVWSIIFGITTLIDEHLHNDQNFMNMGPLKVFTFAAILGGITSIAIRLLEFSSSSSIDPFAAFWTVVLKPVIGAVFAIFIYGALASGLISFGFLPPTDFGITGDGQWHLTLKGHYILWVMCFLAGFSERFAWDFISRAEKVSGGQDSRLAK
jgi:hypothetical protein